MEGCVEEAVCERGSLRLRGVGSAHSKMEKNIPPREPQRHGNAEPGSFGWDFPAEARGSQAGW